MYIDFHCHALPGIDDGSKDIKTSLLMLKALYTYGFKSVVLTPHYYPHLQPLDEFAVNRTRSFSMLSDALSQTDFSDMQLILGAEVYADSLLLNNKDISALAFGESNNNILLELPFTKKPETRMTDFIERLIYSLDYNIILAHIDRYPYLLKEKHLLPLLDMGCKCQVNLSGFNGLIKNSVLKSYFKKGYISVVGNDLHSNDFVPEKADRVFNMLTDEDKSRILRRSKRILGI